MKLLMIHAWNETEVAYRGKFSNLFSYPSLTLAVIYSLIPKVVFEQIDVIDENSQAVNMTPERLNEIYRKVWKEAYSWRRVLKRTFSSPWRKKSYVFIMLGANISFKFLGIDKKINKRNKK